MNQLVAIITTLLKSFFAAALAIVVTWGPSILDKGAGDWRVVLAAGLAAVVLTAYNWLNPLDARYGVGYVPRVRGIEYRGA